MIRKKYCGTAAKAGGNGENTPHPKIMGVPYLLEKFKSIAILFLIALAAPSLSARNYAPVFPSEAPFYSNSDIFVRSGRTAAWGIPMIAVSGKGTVCAVVNQRLDSHFDSGNEQKVVLRRSLDNGKTWLDPQVIAEREGYAIHPSGIVCDEVADKIFVFLGKGPIKDSQGRPLHEKWVVENPEEAIEIGVRFLVIESSDEGKTWSEPRDLSRALQVKKGVIFHGGQGGGNGFQFKKGPYKGRLVLANRTYTAPYLNLHDFGTAVNCVIYSDDHGKAWKPGGVTRDWVGECSIVELSNGAIYLSNRNHDPNTVGVRSHDISYDGGETFTEYGIDPELIEPICHAGITRYDDKTVLFSNPKTGTKFDGQGRRFQGWRLNMTVRASFDDCKTWPIEKLIDPGWAGYSAIAVCKDGTILCLYERGTQYTSVAIGGGSRQNVAIARFNMAWLMLVDKPAEVIAPPKK